MRGFVPISAYTLHHLLTIPSSFVTTPFSPSYSSKCSHIPIFPYSHIPMFPSFPLTNPNQSHYPCISQSIYPPIYPSIHPCTHPSIYAPIYPFTLSIYPSIYFRQSIYPCIHPSIHLSTHAFTHLSIYAPIYPFTPSIYLLPMPFIPATPLPVRHEQLLAAVLPRRGAHH
jgi:hypothetical protein